MARNAEQFQTWVGPRNCGRIGMTNPVGFDANSNPTRPGLRHRAFHYAKHARFGDFDCSVCFLHLCASYCSSRWQIGITRTNSVLFGRCADVGHGFPTVSILFIFHRNFPLLARCHPIDGRADRGSSSAAIDDDLSTCDIRSLVRRQIQCGFRYLIGFTHTTESNHSR